MSWLERLDDAELAVQAGRYEAGRGYGLVDELYARKIRAECSTGDFEINGCRLDDIVAELLERLGMAKTAEAFRDVECWRA